MNYVLTKDGAFVQRLDNNNFRFAPTVFQPAYSLSQEQMDTFGVKPFVEVPAPVYDPVFQSLTDSGTELINGEWTQVWTVAQLPMSASAPLIVQRIQQNLDAFAQTRNYDGILSACTYASSTVTKFKDEGQYCVDLRDNTWATCYTLLAEVEAGTLSITSWAQLEALLPVPAWPA